MSEVLLNDSDQRAVEKVLAAYPEEARPAVETYLREAVRSEVAPPRQRGVVWHADVLVDSSVFSEAAVAPVLYHRLALFAHRFTGPLAGLRRSAKAIPRLQASRFDREVARARSAVESPQNLDGSIAAKFSTKLNAENVENFWAALVNIFSRGEMLASVLHGPPF